MWQDLVSALRGDMERRRDMGMRLNTEHLEMLAEKLVKLESTGVEVTQFKMLEHTVFLTWETEAGQMPKAIVVGISKDQPTKVGTGGLVTRGSGGTYAPTGFLSRGGEVTDHTGLQVQPQGITRGR